MKALEDHLRPNPVSHHLLRDATVIALLLAVGAIVMANWSDLYAYFSEQSELRRLADAAQQAGDGSRWQAIEEARAEASARFSEDVSDAMLGPGLLLALAFVLGFRVGVIDLSVWGVSLLGGVVAAQVLVYTKSPESAVLCALLAGLAVGLVQAALVAGLRWPSILVTGATAGGLMVITRALAGTAADQRSLWLPPGALDAWSDGFGAPLPWLRLLLTLVPFLATVIVLMVADLFAPTRSGQGGAMSRPMRALVMLAGSAVAGLAGAVWMIKLGQAPLPTGPVGSPVPVAAAVLAGALILAGRGRSLMAAALLPVGMLLAGRWQMQVSVVAPWIGAGWTWLLVGQVILTQGAILYVAKVSGRARWIAGIGGVLSAGGVVATSLASLNVAIVAREALFCGGIVASVAGVVAVLASALIGRHARPKGGYEIPCGTDSE